MDGISPNLANPMAVHQQRYDKEQLTQQGQPLPAFGSKLTAIAAISGALFLFLQGLRSPIQVSSS